MSFLVILFFKKGPCSHSLLSLSVKCMQLLVLRTACLKRPFKKKTKNFFNFDLYLGIKGRQNVAQYPVHHVTYAPAKFEVAKSNG